MEEDPGPGVPSPLSPRVMKRQSQRKDEKAAPKKTACGKKSTAAKPAGKTKKPAEDKAEPPKKKARMSSRKTSGKAGKA